MFKDTDEGQTNYCEHMRPEGQICASCLGVNKQEEKCCAKCTDTRRETTANILKKIENLKHKCTVKNCKDSYNNACNDIINSLQESKD